MALQIWLPMLGNLENKGVNSQIITSSGSSAQTAGKIGQCMKITKSTSLQYTPNFNTSNLSFGGWFKFNQSEIAAVVDTLTYSSAGNSPTGNLLGNSAYGGIGLIWNGNNHYTSGAFSSMSVFATLRTSSVNQSTSSFTIEFDKWVHIMLTWNPTTHILSLYKNGVLVNSKTFSSFSDGASRVLSLNYNAIYGGNGPTAQIPFYANDIRIYDECLTAQQVKKISQGLVGHYLLSAPSISLAKYDILEYIQASGGAYVQTDYIANTDKHKCEFKVSLLSASGWHGPFGCYTDENTKSFRLLMKSGSSTDIGLWHYRRAGAGGGPYVTAITAWDQILEGSMDKTTYSITNLSTSNTFTGNINNGTDGSTNTGALTINKSGASASNSNNKVYYLRIYENNILIHYYVPVKQKEINTLGYFDVITQKFWPRTGTSGTMTAGPIINTFSIISKDDLNVYDCSGYNNNGLSNKTIDFIMPSPRYDSAMKFNGSNDAIKIPFNNMIKENFTFSIWFYKSVIGSKAHQTILGGPSGFELELRNGSNADPVIRLYSWGSGTTAYEFNKWNHLVFIRDVANSKTQVYLNGELKLTGSVGSLPSGNYWIGSWRDATSQNFIGNAVDARLYATVFSASDVLELYNTSMIVNSDGTISPRVLTS